MTTRWFNPSDSACTMIRAVTSVPPPGANPTTMRTGYAGQPCANGVPEDATIAAPASAMRMRMRTRTRAPRVTA